MAYGTQLYHQDGRPVGYSLLQHDAPAAPRRSKGPKNPKDGWKRAELWEKNIPFGEEDEAQLERALKSGRGRRRRFFHDRLLKDIAGPLTFADIQSLFQPIPFGDPAPPSAFEQAMAPQNLPVWEGFRSIDMDKQTRVLQAWEQRKAANRSASSSSSSSKPSSEAQSPAAVAQQAIKRWGFIDRRVRQALKRASPSLLFDLEWQLLDPLLEGAAQVEIVLEDPFQRLLMHGVAQYHSLHLRSCGGGDDQPLLRAECSPSQLGGLQEQAHGITCSDLVMAMEQLPAGSLSARALQAICF